MNAAQVLKTTAMVKGAGLILALVGTQWPEALFNTHTWPLDYLCDVFPIFGPSEHQEQACAEQINYINIISKACCYGFIL